MRKINEPDLWSPALKNVFKKFKKPHDIQLYLNKLKYNSKYECSSPEMVVKKKRAHCTEGVFFAAAALRYLGFEPLVLFILASYNDDDHFIALFRRNGFWGAVSKSNYTVLRYREPVYKNVRELAMSYFDMFFNSLGRKTMRAYSVPVNLRSFDKYKWMTTQKDIAFISNYFDKVKHYKIVDKKMIHSLSHVDKELLKGGLLGSNKEGLFKPKKKKLSAN
jgi:hypothetical protein